MAKYFLHIPQWMLLIRLCFAISSDYLHLIEDYTKNVKGFHSITLLSCPSRFSITAWISLVPDPSYLFRYVDTSSPSGVNLTSSATETNCRQVVVLDLSCPGYANALHELSDQKQFNGLCLSFLLLGSEQKSDIEERQWFEEELRPLLETIEFTYISNVALGMRFSTAADPEQEQQQLQITLADTTEGTTTTNAVVGGDLFIYDVWNPGLQQGGRLHMDLVGVYRGGVSYLPLDDTIMAHRRLDLSELHLQCAIVVTSPFNDTLESYITHNYDPYLDTVHRLNYRTLTLVQEYFKFKLRVRRVHSWGYVQNASAATTFDGMVGMVQREEVQFGCSPAWFRLERLQVVDYGAQTWAIRPIFLFRHPNTKGLGKNVFLEPFEDPVWTVLLVSSGIIIVLMANAIQQDKGVLQLTGADNGRGIVANGQLIRDSLVHAFKSFVQSARIYVSVILQQGVPTTDEGHLLSTKLAVFLLFVYSFLLIQFYSASIVGSLLMTPPKTIRSIPDLTASRLKVGIQDIVYNYEFFKHTTDRNALELYEKKVRVLDKAHGNYTLNYYSVDEGLRKLQYEPFAFHVDLDYVFQRIIHSFNEKDICDLTMIYLYPQQPMGNVFPKGSPYRYVMNYGVHRARESGLFTREKNLWITETPVCTRQIHTEDFQVELFPLMSLYWLLLGGCALSVGILGLEIVVHRLFER